MTLHLTDLILPPLLAYLIATLLGTGLAVLRARRHGAGWLALDVVALLPVLIPVPVIAGALLAASPPDANRVVPWILAAALTAAPLAYLPARIALTRTTATYRDTARLLGLGPLGRFFRIDVPLTWPALGRGTLLALTRVAGEWLLALEVVALDRLTPLTAGLAALALLAALGIAFSLNGNGKMLKS